MVCVGDGRVVYGDVPGHPLASLLAAVAALAGARPVHSQVGPGYLHQKTNIYASEEVKNIFFDLKDTKDISPVRFDDSLG